MTDKPTYEELEKRVRELESLESERKQMAESLRSLGEHVSFYRNAVGSMEDYKIAVVGPDYRYRIVSPQYLKIYNLTGAEIVGRTVAEIMGDDVFEHAIKPNLDRAKKGRTVNHSDWFELSDKGKRYLEVSYYPVVDEDQEVVSVIALSHDITEKRRIDEALRDSEERTRSILQVIPDIIIQTNVQGEYLDIRTSSEDLLLMSKRELMGKRISDLFPEKVATRIIECIKTAIDTNRLQSVEYELELPTGKFSFEARIVSSGEDKALALIRDITERKAAEEALLDSEQNYRNLVENANEAIFVAQDENLVFFNLKTIALTGYSDEELRSRPFIEFIHPDDREMVIDRHVRRLKGEELPHLYPFRVLHKDGSIMWGELNAVLINWDGKPATLNFLSDITERKQAEEELQASEAKYRNLIETLNEGIWSIDAEGATTFVNKRMEEMLGYGPGEMLGKHLFDFMDEGARKKAEEFQRRRKQGINEQHDFEFMRKDGRRVFGTLATSPILDAHGAYAGALAGVVDITERKKAEENLRQERERLAGIIRGTNAGTWEWNVQTGETIFNERWAEIVGYPLDEISPVSIETWMRFSHPDDLKISNELLEKHFRGELDYYEFESRMKHKRGDWVWVLDRGRVISWTQDGKPLMMMGTHQDINRRKIAEEAFLKSEAKYRDLFDSNRDGIIRTELDGSIIEVNQAFLEMTGYESFDDLKGRYQELTPEKWYDLEAEIVRNQVIGRGYSDEYEKEYIHRNGAVFPINIKVWLIKDNDQAVGMWGIVRDITESKRAEEERDKLQARLSQAHKMEAIGTLAGGIAHDFNNILSVIVGNAELAMLDVPEWSPAQDNLKEAREATLRARELVKQILLFARQKEHTVSSIRLEPIAKESIKMLRASIPTTVQIRKNIREGLPSVLADPSQIQQIIMNLCTNAGQIMEAEGGTLTFTLDSADLETPLHTNVEELSPGRYVRMQVKDTGPGIPPENLGKIFDPFFTTKGVGEGTGLGLAVVHGIVLDRKGGITVESEEGRGTTFTIYLPASDVPSTEVTAEQKWELPRGTERVLFVDDEAMILKLGQRMLERLGYKVETRASGTDALECFRQDPNRFDLVVTDMTMPGMRGDRLAEEILAIRPDIPIILCTGYSRQISKEKAGELGIRAFVMKPLTQHELANTVRRVLDEKPRK